MKLPLFYRLIIGYVIIFLFMAAASIHAIQVLFQFNKVITILDLDKKVSETNTRLSDLLFSEIQFEKKFRIFKDENLFDQFIQAKEEFRENLSRLMPLIESEQIREVLQQIQGLHEKYVSWFSEEAEYLRKHRLYRKELYKEEKEKTIEALIGNLNVLSSLSQQATYNRIRELGKVGANASQMNLIISMASLLVLIAFTIYMTRKITRPLSLLTEKTKEIARGDYSGSLKINSPPEIKAFAEAFNSMSLRLQEVEKVKSDFFSLMSHELRTPLTSIKEGTNLLLEGIGGDITEKQKKLLSIIAQESNRLITLVNSLLDLSKMEAGMMEFSFRKEALVPLVQQVIKEIEPISEAKQVRLKTDFEAGLPPVRLDRERILQALRNLLGNALKFTSNNGEIFIATRKVPKGIEVSIRDTGVGIAKELLPSIFEKFRQATLTKATKIQGTGLGLAVVKHIIQGHGGTVWAESELGQGSTFFFFLPL
jgi:signal transduction histidine kinase